MGSLAELWPIVLAVLGIGLVIFVHEAGHFVAARLCKVRVEVFSLGFGPRLFGWRRKGTLYQIAAVPLGGYVKMAGDDSWMDAEDPAPDSLGAKSVGQRFFIFSGGVLANLAFGIVVFPILFARGVPFDEPLLGPPQPGSPAWQAGLPEGSRVLSVNGNPVYSFMHIPTEVALGPSERCELVLLEPGAAEPRRVELEPRYSEAEGIYSIGVGPAIDREGRLEVLPGSPASEAGLRSGDRLIDVLGEIPELELWRRFRRVLTDGAPLRATFERDGEAFQVEVLPRPAAQAAYARIGVSAPVNLVADRRDSPRTRGLDLLPGDRILSVDGAPIFSASALSDALWKALGRAHLTIARAGAERGLSLDLGGREAVPAFLSDLQIALDGESTVLAVSPGEPAWRAGLRDGDRVVRIDGAEVSNYQEITDRSRAAAASGRAMTFALLRSDPQSGEARALEIDVAPEPFHPLEYGLGPRIASYVFRVENPLLAIQVGIRSCWKFLQDTWLTLKGIVTARVSPKNLGGPIAIGVYAHSWASAGLSKFFFFLCILSINLAFINVLPIPLLDGGHLFFLLIEKIKGSPVSERVMNYSQLVGLVLIVSLFVFVFYNDVQRHIFG
jgi:regulator of sigma E protease